MIGTRTKVRDLDKGFSALVAELGRMGTITLGVQGREAAEVHPRPDNLSRGLTVGAIAARQELGFGVPKRSWLVSWMDRNQGRLLSETRAKLRLVMLRRVSRKAALVSLGYKWTEELRENIDRNEVSGPPLSKATVERKGHDIRVLETAAIRNAITWRLYLPNVKTIGKRAWKQREIVEKGPLR